MNAPMPLISLGFWGLGITELVVILIVIGIPVGLVFLILYLVKKK